MEKSSSSASASILKSAVKRETSGDSQAQGSVNVSQITTSSGDTFNSNKLGSIDLIDACVQADLKYEIITYDSDDEMVKSRRGIPFGGLRNKKGHPIYSREDIREQYCITRKELEVLDALHSGTSNRFFGCLSTSHLPDQSPCNKNSFLLLSCIQRQENSGKNEKDSDPTKVIPHSIPHHISNITEDEDSDGGFRQRQSRHLMRNVDPCGHRYGWTQGLSGDTLDGPNNNFSGQQIMHNENRDLPGYVYPNVNSYVEDRSRSRQRPSRFPFDPSMGVESSGTSHSVDELNDQYSSNYKEIVWRRTSSSTRAANTPDIILDGGSASSDATRHMKHVSFDSNNLVRSATVGGINMNAMGGAGICTPSVQYRSRNISPPSPSITSSTSTSRAREMSPPVSSHERLLGPKFTAIPIPSLPMHPQPSPTSTSLSTPYRLMRRTVMKTQATQTEITGLIKTRSCRSIPAYLTLSPRATNQNLIQRRSFDSRSAQMCQYHHRLALRSPNSLRVNSEESAATSLPVSLIKSHSAHGMIIPNNYDDSDDEVMAVCIREHHHRPSRKKTKSHQKEQIIIKSPSTEYLMSDVMTFPKPEVKSYSNDEVFNQLKSDNISEEEFFIVRQLMRRHSAIAELAAEPIIPVMPFAEPPPGFEDTFDEPITDDVKEADDSPLKSNTESSRAVISDISDLMSSTTEMEDLQSSINSKENYSSTIISEMIISPLPLAKDESSLINLIEGPELQPLESALIQDPSIDSLTSDVVTDRSLMFPADATMTMLRKPKQKMLKHQPKTVESPESESPSHHTSPSSSVHEPLIDLLLTDGRRKSDGGSGISVYLSPRDYSLIEMGSDVREEKNHETGQTSFETASSGSVISSPPSVSRRRKSSSSSTEQKSSENELLIAALRPSSLKYLKAFEDFRSDASSGDLQHSPGSGESMGGSTPHNLSDIIDESDVTPVHDAVTTSSDPSTAFSIELTTVVENVQTKPKVPPKPIFLLGDTKITIKEELKLTPKPYIDTVTHEVMKREPSINKSIAEESKSDSKKGSSEEYSFETETLESDDYDVGDDKDSDEIIIDDTSGDGALCRRSHSGELSTVSEVSEEMSCNHKGSGHSSDRSINGQKLELIDENSKEKDTSGAMRTTLSGTNGGLSSPLEGPAIHSGGTSPSFAESTTSGSFMIDGNVTEPTSLAEDEAIAIGKAGSLPCIPTQTIARGGRVSSECGKLSEKIEIEIGTSSTTTTDLDNNNGVNRNKMRYEPIVYHLMDIGGESQATERDMEKSEFSLQHQSSQDIDEESFSLDAANQSGGSLSQKDVGKRESRDHIQVIEGDEHIQDLSTASESTTTQQLSAELPKVEKAPEDVHLPLGNSDYKSISLASNNSHRRDKEKKRSKSDHSHGKVSHEQEIHGLSADEKHQMQRRARSLSRSPEKMLDTDETSPVSLQQPPPILECSHHHFTCSQCGESAHHQNVPSLLRRSRLERAGIPYPYRKSVTIDDIYFNGADDEEDIGVHSESYRSALWVYVGKKDEFAVWGHRNSLNNKTNNGESSITRSESDESTLSERGFRKQFEAVTHRLIHRKASIEMYKRVLSRTFEIDKCLKIERKSGEFGFRIHGSRPVVVSAIEKGTPAENCGLEVGDIIVSVNGANVLDASHSEVVKLAHTGPETLELDVVNTSNTIKNDKRTVEHDIIMNGHLYRLTDRSKHKMKLSDSESDTPHTPSQSLPKSTSDGTNKLWRRRWFVLKSDFCLYWYKTPKGTDPVGAISLQGYCAGLSQEPIHGQEFAFRIVRYGSQAKFFAANDKDIACQWINALNQSATRINQVDPYIDQTLHNIHCKPLEFVNPDCCGYLGKFSQRRKVWRHRYFVLKDACLYFYHNSNAITALGVFYLHGYKVQSCLMIGKKHTFEGIPPEPKYRHLWLMAESDVDKKRWLAALEYSIDRWIRLK